MVRVHYPASGTAPPGPHDHLVGCVWWVARVSRVYVSVVIAVGSRPVPFRTRKLSPPAPMVLHLGGCGRVGHRRPLNIEKRVSASRPLGCDALTLFLHMCPLSDSEGGFARLRQLIVDGPASHRFGAARVRAAWCRPVRFRRRPHVVPAPISARCRRGTSPSRAIIIVVARSGVRHREGVLERCGEER